MQGVDQLLYRDALAQVRGQYGDYQAKLATLNAQIARYAAALPLAEERAKNYAVLSQTQDVSATTSSEKQQAVIELAGELNQARSSRESLITETRKQALEAMNQASRTIAMAVEDAARASSHEHQMILRAPVDGVVQQLTAHTVGGVVPAAETLMYVVPVNDAVEVEAYVQNKDVGFVHAGQDAQVKIDAFDYTRHGSLHGFVSHVSTDAVSDEKRGWVYRLRVMLDRDSMIIEGHPRRLMPGMTVKVEVKTGRRRVIEYLLSPLARHRDESLHER
jgi:hemolysin D